MILKCGSTLFVARRAPVSSTPVLNSFGIDAAWMQAAPEIRKIIAVRGKKKEAFIIFSH
jgi:hypothetical protein